jgi:hypothetical protein
MKEVKKMKKREGNYNRLLVGDLYDWTYSEINDYDFELNREKNLWSEND